MENGFDSRRTLDVSVQLPYDKKQNTRDGIVGRELFCDKFKL